MNIKAFSNFSFSHLIISIFIIAIYFIGFKFKDYVPGGGPEDFTNFIWNNINNFQNDLQNSLINYNKMADANFPGFYVFSSLNPFAYSISSFHLFSFSLGFLTFILCFDAPYFLLPSAFSSVSTNGVNTIMTSRFMVCVFLL